MSNIDHIPSTHFWCLKFPCRGVCISWLLWCLNHTEVPCLSWKQTPFECVIWLPSNASTFLFDDFSNQNVAVQPLFNLVPGRVLPAKLLCWVNFPVFPENASHLMGQLTPFQRSESTGITLSGPMTHLNQQLTSLLTPARHSIWSPFDTCSNEFLATWQSKPTRSPCKFSFKTSRSCGWSGGSPVPVHTNNWLRVFLFNSCNNGVGCRNAKRALTAKTTG